MRTWRSPGAYGSRAVVPIDRRQFLSRTVAATAAVATGCGPGRGNRTETGPARGARSRPPTAGSAGDLRRHFDLSPDYVHLAGLLLASHPTSVRRAIARHRRGLDDNPVLYIKKHRRRLSAEVRQQAGRYMAVDPERISLTDSTTMGLGIMYGGLRLGPDDEILTTGHDHYSTIESLRLSCSRSGARLRRVDLYDDGRDATFESMVGAIAAAVGPNTRLVAVTWVHSSSGVKLPIAAIAAAIARINASRDTPVLLFVDGVHGFGVENATMADLGCDAFIAGTHKWILGPRGTGLIWANDRGWAAVEATIPCFESSAHRAWLAGESGASVPKPEQMTPGGYHSFEHRWAVAEAFEFHLQIGKQAIESHIHGLATALKEGLAAMPHVRLHTPMDEALSSGIVCFEVAGQTPHQTVSALLERRVIASTTPYRTSYARLAPALFNSIEEIERTLARIRELA